MRSTCLFRIDDPTMPRRWHTDLLPVATDARVAAVARVVVLIDSAHRFGGLTPRQSVSAVFDLISGDRGTAHSRQLLIEVPAHWMWPTAQCVLRFAEADAAYAGWQMAEDLDVSCRAVCDPVTGVAELSAPDTVMSVWRGLVGQSVADAAAPSAASGWSWELDADELAVEVAKLPVGHVVKVASAATEIGVDRCRELMTGRFEVER